MARSQNSFLKKVKEEKKRKKKQEKFEKKMEKKNQPTSGKLNDMLAYVDENGNITTENPEVKKEEKES
ncbi:MAG: cold-shock protein [Cyclobacteriaceae bacterium]